MAGPVVNFIENLREKRPVRNAIRGAFGMEPVYGQPMNSLDAMSAREREMGVNVLDDREQRRQPSTKPAGYATDEQPYTGMGMMQAMVTAPSDALAQNRKQAASPLPSPLPPTGEQEEAAGPKAMLAAMPNTQAAQAGTMPAPTFQQQEMARIEMLERQAMNYAARAAMEADERRMAAFGVMSNNFYKLAEKARDRMHQSDMASLAMSGRVTLEDKERLIDRAAQERRNTLDHAATLQERLMAGEQSRQTRQYLSEDLVSPLKDRALPVEVYARNEANAALAENIANKAQDPSAGTQGVYENAYLRGMGTRVGQHLQDMVDSGGAGPAFGPGHPGLEEFKFHYRSKVNQNPKDYEAIRAQVGAAVLPSVMKSLSATGLPPAQAMRYADGLINDILGPPPQDSSIMSSLGKMVFGE